MAALEIVQSIFPAVWRFFTDNTVPGLGVPFSALFVGILLAKLSLLIVRHALGIGSGTGYRSGSTRNPKISDSRKGDEY